MADEIGIERLHRATAGRVLVPGDGE